METGSPPSPASDAPPGVTPARDGALRILRAVAAGRRADAALEEVLADLRPGDRRWTHRAAYGTLRLRGRIDHLLDLHVHRGLAGVDPALLDVLRLGAYQLLEMDSVPAYAAVSQAVSQAKAVGGAGAGGFVNGVLRSLSRDGAAPGSFPSLEEDPAGHLAARGSHPRWLVERWLRRWSPEEVARLVEEGNREPPVTLRPVGVAVAEARRALEQAGIEAHPVGRGTGCLRLAEAGAVEAALARIPAVVQDPAAALVTAFAGIPAGAPVADLCAAPGGKAAALAGEGRRVLAADLRRERLAPLRENASRTGADIVPVVADARRPPLRPGPAVLLDVPCTGTGTLRRNPDLKWRLDPGAPRRMAGAQRELLEGAAAAVAPGGLLVYATCSLEPEENEERVEAFLEARRDFERAGPGPVPEDVVDERGDLRVEPQRTGYDGAYAARLTRRDAGDGEG